MQNEFEVWYTALERMAPSHTEEVYHRFGAAVFGSAMRLCASQDGAEKLLEQTFVLLCDGYFRHEPMNGRPLLWLLGCLYDTALIQEGTSLVNARTSLNLRMRCFGLDPALLEDHTTDNTTDLTVDLLTNNHLPFRKALGRA